MLMCIRSIEKKREKRSWHNKRIRGIRRERGGGGKGEVRVFSFLVLGIQDRHDRPPPYQEENPCFGVAGAADGKILKSSDKIATIIWI